MKKTTMSDRAKPWLETWRTDHDNSGDPTIFRPLLAGESMALEVATFAIYEAPNSQVSEQYARRDLAAAAPALARALCRLEWATGFCEACYRKGYYCHRPGCSIDAALTAAGLSAEDREEVRRG